MLEPVSDPHPVIGCAAQQLHCIRTSRLPVLYVFGKRLLGIDACSKKLAEYIHEHTNVVKDIERILLKHDVVYSHVAGAPPMPMPTHFKVS